jgi:glycosyltransferase involved in cell wall biosynthesis
MPQISIIIPVYNAQNTLTDCLQSIYHQTLNSYEIIAVNDGSTDSSRQILEQYRDKITVIDQPNAGAPAARNSGAKIARAPFLLFCDADIILNRDCLQKMSDALQRHPESSYIYSSFIFGSKKFKLWPFDPGKLKQMPYIHTASLLRREHFPGFDKKLKRFQDWDLWLTMLEAGHTGWFIDEILFRVKAGGTMSAWLPSFLYKIPFLPQVKKYRLAEKIIKSKHGLGR